MPKRRAQPAPEYNRRLQACRQRIQRREVDGYLISSRVDQFYLTGFDGEDGAALVLPRVVYLITDGRFTEAVDRAAPWARAVIRTGPLPDAIARLTRRHRITRLAIQPEHLTVADHARIRRAVRPARLVAMPGAVGDLRLIKDDTEIKAIQRAARVAEGAFRTVIGRLRLGTTERALAAELQHEMVRRGASEASFPIIVAEGPNAALPHAQPGDRRIRRGSAVLIDWGATVDHYRSDLTRVIFVRRIPPRFRRMYENVLAAQEAAIRAIRPGEKMGDIDAVARGKLEEAGMAEHFSHGLGHGVGLDIHEPPRLAARVKDRLAPGMVVTVEPGVYYRGVGGVRIEDDVVVTPTGCRVISRLPKDLDSTIV